MCACLIGFNNLSCCCCCCRWRWHWWLLLFRKIFFHFYIFSFAINKKTCFSLHSHSICHRANEQMMIGNLIEIIKSHAVGELFSFLLTFFSSNSRFHWMWQFGGFSCVHKHSDHIRRLAGIALYKLRHCLNEYYNYYAFWMLDARFSLLINDS